MGRQGTEGHQLGRGVAGLKGLASIGELLENHPAEALMLTKQTLEVESSRIRGLVRIRPCRRPCQAIGFAGGLAEPGGQLPMAEGIGNGGKFGAVMEGLGPVHGKGCGLLLTL